MDLHSDSASAYQHLVLLAVLGRIFVGDQWALWTLTTVE
jgi:hypothetical protein